MFSLPFKRGQKENICVFASSSDICGGISCILFLQLFGMLKEKNGLLMFRKETPAHKGGNLKNQALRRKGVK